MSLRFEPLGPGWFWHKGYLFVFYRQKHVVSNGSNGFEEDKLTVTVPGRSTAPIKKLINEVRGHYIAKEENLTMVRRPLSGGQRRFFYPWAKVASRPSRSIETVALNPEEKSKVLDDINEYLHPDTQDWYADRGIPYRRGYLFSGPPGTGKTSMSSVIAGVFGLDIHCISLLDPTLSEDDLLHLFSNLPRRCAVLLEDIDAAGLERKEAKTLKENTTDEKQGSSISLSGLLNAIDGVASPEGRVLLMTTNHVEKIDGALIRPGRVDMHIEFSLATRTQAEEIFARMYSS